MFTIDQSLPPVGSEFGRGAARKCMVQFLDLREVRPFPRIAWPARLEHLYAPG
jgi:hypothetical protein